MERFLGGATFVGRAPVIEGADSFYFRRGPSSVVAVRSRGEPFDVPLAAVEAVTEIDAWGNARRHEPRDGVIRVRLEREVSFLLGLWPGYDETVEGVTVKEASFDGAVGALQLTGRNLVGGRVRLIVREPESGATVEIDLPPDGEAREGVGTLEVDPDTGKRLQSERRAVFEVSLLVGGERKYRKEIARRVFWGTRRFSISEADVAGDAVRFRLRFGGTARVRGHVYLVEDRGEERMVVWEWSNVTFDPGVDVPFSARGNAGPLRILVIAEGGGDAEEFDLPRSRRALAERLADPAGD